MANRQEEMFHKQSTLIGVEVGGAVPSDKIGGYATLIETRLYYTFSEIYFTESL